jgi:hypothetical protein
VETDIAKAGKSAAKIEASIVYCVPLFPKIKPRLLKEANENQAQIRQEQKNA